MQKHHHFIYIHRIYTPSFLSLIKKEGFHHPTPYSIVFSQKIPETRAIETRQNKTKRTQQTKPGQQNWGKILRNIIVRDVCYLLVLVRSVCKLTTVSEKVMSKGFRECLRGRSLIRSRRHSWRLRRWCSGRCCRWIRCWASRRPRIPVPLKSTCFLVCLLRMFSFVLFSRHTGWLQSGSTG